MMDTRIKPIDFGTTKNVSIIERNHHNHFNHYNFNHNNNYNNKDTTGITSVAPIPVAVAAAITSKTATAVKASTAILIPTINSITKTKTTENVLATSSSSSSLSSPPSSLSSSSLSGGIILSTPTNKQITVGNNNGVGGSGSNNSHNIIPSDILDDLASRFIINVPDDERNNLIRICFQIELAHWFYLDFFCSIEDKKLMPCGMKQFAMLLFQHIPFLRAHLSGIDKILEDWKEYKLSVPTYGAILVSKDLKQVLLVQSYWAKSSWGFPKGKVNEHEDPVHCAAREVFEETGYDISNLIVPNDYIEAVINYQYTRLYLVRNIPLETIFSPRTRKEIKCIEWFPVDSLPTNKNDVISKQNLGINANSFFMIMPFIKRLKKWVQDNRSGNTNHNNSCNTETSLLTMASSATTTTLSAVASTVSVPVGKISPPLSSIGATTTPKSAVISMETGTVPNNNSFSVIMTSSLLGNKRRDFKISQNVSTNISNNNNNSALITHKSSYKQKNNNNNNTYLSCKRQRHKSMGDIDGIKLNFNIYNTNCYNGNNNNNNNSKYYNGTKLNTIQSSINQDIDKTNTTVSAIGETLTSLLSSTENNLALSSSLTPTLPSPLISSNSINNNNNKRDKYSKTNFNKRQVLTSTNSNNNTCSTGNNSNNTSNSSSSSNNKISTNNNISNLINGSSNSNCTTTTTTTTTTTAITTTNNSNIININSHNSGIKSNNNNNSNNSNVRSQFSQHQLSKKQQQYSRGNNNDSNNNKNNLKLSINNNNSSNINNQNQCKDKDKYQKTNDKPNYNHNNFINTNTSNKKNNNINNNNNKNKISSVTHNIKSTSTNTSIDSNLIKAYHKFTNDELNNDESVQKLSPDFDSWQSFTFTKNFISNVFFN